MADKIWIRNVRLINEGEEYETDVLVEGERIAYVGHKDVHADEEIEGGGLCLMPGIIDDQVHFREPGLTHKADIFTESRAGVAGGVTSFMEMPNTKPPATTQKLLQDKYDIARSSSWANYSFYMGATNDNLEEVLKTDARTVCGIKIFMGSSTGNMLVDQDLALENLFKNCPILMATHCEDEETIRRNMDKYVKAHGDNISTAFHPTIRSVDGCYISSSKAVALAKKYGSRLHVLHISTEKEIDLFETGNRSNKNITSEACVHHMYFDDRDYRSKGNFIKCNPAIKSEMDRDAIRRAVVNGQIDVIATDHAPHTFEEKQAPYLQAPSGLPLIQHTLQVMLSFHRNGWMPLTLLVDRMCHAVADIFKIKDRGYVRSGYFADLVLFDPNPLYEAENNKIWSKCGWSPFDNEKLYGKIHKTIINGRIVYDNGQFNSIPGGMRLEFNRLKT